MDCLAGDEVGDDKGVRAGPREGGTKDVAGAKAHGGAGGIVGRCRIGKGLGSVPLDLVLRDIPRGEGRRAPGHFDLRPREDGEARGLGRRRHRVRHHGLGCWWRGCVRAVGVVGPDSDKVLGAQRQAKDVVRRVPALGEVVAALAVGSADVDNGRSAAPRGGDEVVPWCRQELQRRRRRLSAPEKGHCPDMALGPALDRGSGHRGAPVRFWCGTVKGTGERNPPFPVARSEGVPDPEPLTLDLEELARCKPRKATGLVDGALTAVKELVAKDQVHRR
mmetsp:Transcript_31225/g.90748  ORF Transcript_31225/g.90748 Transcript_31225/m.90748 type:complete len:277 (+) Transcript_31225:3437-4267(+)